MAKIQQIQKSRKEQKCSKCGKIIPVGSSYLKAEPYMRSPIIRCVDCGLKSYETSGSEYIQRVGEIVEDWRSTFEQCEAIADDISYALESIRYDCQERLDNMPEQLQYSEAGELLQTRIDSLEDAINELSNCDYYITQEDIEDDAREDFANENDLEVKDSAFVIPEEEDPSLYDPMEQYEADFQDFLEDQVYQALGEKIDEALACIEM